MDILYNILKYINNKIILHKIKKNGEYLTITRGAEKIIIIKNKCYKIA